MNEPLKQPERINYIDSLRGLSMILVVLAHVFLFMSPHHWDGSPLAAILMSFRMPLFFFVSGFFAYRALDRWTGQVTGDIVVRKARAQLLCATVFFMLWQAIHHAPAFAFIEKGYDYFWFTIALFQMFMVYVGFVWLSKLLRRNIVDWALIALIVASLFGNFIVFRDGVGVTLSWHQVLVYWQYFAVGVLARRWWPFTQRMLDNDWFRAVVVVLFVGGCFLFYRDWYTAPHDLGEYLTQGVLHRYVGLFTVLIFFYQRAWYFDGNAAVARFLRFTGKRTLDIYMMHIFFIPHMSGLAWVTAIWAPDMAIVKLTIGLAIALAVTCVCLLCSQILRSSHFLAVWLFGVRRKPKTQKN